MEVSCRPAGPLPATGFQTGAGSPSASPCNSRAPLASVPATYSEPSSTASQGSAASKGSAGNLAASGWPLASVRRCTWGRAPATPGASSMKACALSLATRSSPAGGGQALRSQLFWSDASNQAASAVSAMGCSPSVSNWLAGAPPGNGGRLPVAMLTSVSARAGSMAQHSNSKPHSEAAARRRSWRATRVSRGEPVIKRRRPGRAGAPRLARCSRVPATARLSAGPSSARQRRPARACCQTSPGR